MTLDLTASDVAGADHLIRLAGTYLHEVARQRSALRAAWLAETRAVETLQAQLRAVDSTLSSRQEILDQTVTNFGEAPDTFKTYDIPEVTVNGWLQPNGTDGWAVHRRIERAFDADHQSARQRFIEARAKTFGGGARRAGAEALGRYSTRLAGLAKLGDLLENRLHAARTRRAETVRAQRELADRALSAAEEVAQLAIARLPAPLQPWSSPVWGQLASQAVIPGIDRVYAGILTPLADGDLGDNADLGSAAKIPFFLAVDQNIEIVYDAGTRAEALGFARSLLLRRLAATNPGDLQFCFFDPVGLGQSASGLLDLAEYDPALIGGKVWSSQADLAARLADLTAHIELVIQKYLRSTYESIEQFNAAAGEIAEPYRLLVLFDSPAGLTEESAARLKSIVQNGPRCGVHTLLLTNTGTAAPYGVDLGQLVGDLRRINFGVNFVDEHLGYRLQMQLRPETDADQAGGIPRTIVDVVGRRSLGRTESAVTSRRSSGCSGTSHAAAFAPSCRQPPARPWWTTRRRGGGTTARGGSSRPSVRRVRATRPSWSSTPATTRARCSSADPGRVSRRCCTPSSAG